MHKPMVITDYSPQALLALLSEWQQAGWLSQLDVAFARFLWQNAEGKSADAATQMNSTTLLLAALVSQQIAAGHVCLPLDRLLTSPLVLAPNVFRGDNPFVDSLANPADLLAGLTLNNAVEALRQSGVVLEADQLSSPDRLLPLVLHRQALYLYRYWSYEQTIATDLRQLMFGKALTVAASAELSRYLDELFPSVALPSASPAETNAFGQINWQKLACANTLRSQFSIITGGPGTGKTFTVVRLLALLQRLQLATHGCPLQIKLAAPTGKAAARLKESIQGALASLNSLPDAWQPALSQISAESSTLHKLLGVQAASRQFKQHRAKPLALDVLIVDEASMVDIDLMQALLAALPPTARLILLGDKDQLASVEAGAVLGQLCEGAEGGGYQSASFNYLQQFSDAPLPKTLLQPDGPRHLQHVVMLRESRRFNAHSGIGALARVVNQADISALTPLFNNGRYQDLQLLATQGQTDASLASMSWQETLIPALKQLCQKGFSGYWQAIQARPVAGCTLEQMDSWARTVLKAYQGFQLLTPVREGPFGVKGLNELVQNSLSFLPTIKVGHDRGWYEGRPVMITANDYNLNLRNGDVGMVLISPIDGQKRAVFIDSDDRVRWILPSRLTEVETVFAMTVHKSQGSEFSHTVMILPERDNSVLSRELIYTGITRAAKQLTLVVPDWSVLVNAITRKTVRAGGLRLGE